jgi:predicted N-acyltransferase
MKRAGKDYRLTVHDTISGIDRDIYNDIIDSENPFLEYEFLEAMEKSGCVGPYTAWNPRHIVLYDGNRIAGAVSAYIKTDSYGEYIFDWEWARAFENSRLRYYPKLVVAIPFTPATGRRISVHPNARPSERAVRRREVLFSGSPFPHGRRGRIPRKQRVPDEDHTPVPLEEQGL